MCHIALACRRGSAGDRKKEGAVIPDALVEKLTCRLTLRSSGRTYTIVRPGLGLALYYGAPLHAMTQSLEGMIQAYLNFVPAGAITALCGRDTWGSFKKSSLRSKLAKLKNRRVN